MLVRFCAWRRAGRACDEQTSHDNALLSKCKYLPCCDGLDDAAAFKRSDLPRCLCSMFRHPMRSALQRQMAESRTMQYARLLITVHTAQSWPQQLRITIPLRPCDGDFHCQTYWAWREFVVDPATWPQHHSALHMTHCTCQRQSPHSIEWRSCCLRDSTLRHSPTLPVRRTHFC